MTVVKALPSHPDGLVGDGPRSAGPSIASAPPRANGDRQEESGLDVRGQQASARSPITSVLTEYVEAFGWSVAAGGEGLRLRCGTTADAVIMPVGLAGEVNHLLKTHGLSAPVLGIHGSVRRWAFLTLPKPPNADDRNVRVLALHKVQHFGPGRTLSLPPSLTDQDTDTSWIAPPVWPMSTGLPPWGAVIACAITAVSR